jgi:hypothetical protein
VIGGERVVPEPEPLHRAGLEVLGDHVVVRNQLLHELDAARVLQIDADALLAQVVAQIGRTDLSAVVVADRRLCGAPRLAVHRVLDLHHLGAEVREQLRGERHCLHLLDREDPHAGERAIGERSSCSGAGTRGSYAMLRTGERRSSWGLKAPNTRADRCSRTESFV